MLERAQSERSAFLHYNADTFINQVKTGIFFIFSCYVHILCELYYVNLRISCRGAQKCNVAKTCEFYEKCFNRARNRMYIVWINYDYYL